MCSLKIGISLYLNVVNIQLCRKEILYNNSHLALFHKKGLAILFIFTFKYFVKIKKYKLRAMREYNIAIVGATGLVGRTMIKVLEERNFPVANLKLLASARSVGTKISFKGKEYIVEELTENSFKEMDIALFSAGGEMSKIYAPFAQKDKCIAIDNSSYWRLDSNTPLVVPEVNPNHLKNHNYIIANPNCSTIQLLVILKAIKEKYGLERVVCSTYQSISGAGQKGLDKLNFELENTDNKQGKHRIAFNAMFHTIGASGISEEETKMIKESRKMLDMPDLKISVTCVRLPILGGHAETVNITTNKAFEINEVRALLAETENVIVIDNPENEEYPTPALAQDKDEVFVGRIRRDDSAENSMNLWVVADNLRKGAATNAVQIAEKLIEMKLV